MGKRSIALPGAICLNNPLVRKQARAIANLAPLKPVDNSSYFQLEEYAADVESPISNVTPRHIGFESSSILSWPEMAVPGLGLVLTTTPTLPYRLPPPSDDHLLSPLFHFFQLFQLLSSLCLSLSSNSKL